MCTLSTCRLLLISPIALLSDNSKKIKDGQSTPSTARTAPVDPAEVARQGRIVALTGTIQSLESEMQDAVFNLRRSRGSELIAQ